MGERNKFLVTGYASRFLWNLGHFPIALCLS